MDPSLLTVLSAHNPWLGSEGRRQSELLTRTLPHPLVPRSRHLQLRPGQAELVVGPRQAGKSTWIRASLSREQTPPVLLLHAEEPRIRELCVSPAQALAALAGVLTDDTLLFLEEAQHLRDAGLFIKGVVDLEPRRRLVATGSSAFHLYARTRESLAGRARRTLLLPFSLDELMQLEGSDALPAMREARQARLWEEMLVRGGYPRAWLDEDAATELRYLVEAFVLKDASDLHAIEHPAAFRKLLELAAADVGNLVNLSAWAALAGVSRDTVSRYLLDLAAGAHVIRAVTPFAGGRRAEITGAPKLFFVDNGLRNALVGGFEPASRRSDLGPLWENGVFCELLKHTDLLDTIQFWRTKNGAEVDFVVQRAGRLIGVEVKAALLRRPQLSRSSQSFIAAYTPSRFVVINAGLRLDSELHGVPVLFRRPWELHEVLD